MFIRMILFISLLSSLSMATEVTTNFRNQITYLNGALNVRIDYWQDEDRDTRDKSKDWVATYKVGSTNAWKNVITWSWVKDLIGEAPGDDYGHIFEGTHLVEAGEYEVRFFKNNSYIVDKSVKFSIKKVKSFLVDIVKPNHNVIYTRGFDDKNFVPGKKDWIGIYKENDDNTWENVVQWTWLTDIKGDPANAIYELPLNKNLYKIGTKYQARYFLNNGFSTHKETRPFYVGERPDDDKEVFLFAYIEKENDGYVIGSAVDKDYVESSKDWIGIFKSDVEFTDLSNLIAWSYVSKDHASKRLAILKPELLVSKGDYKAVFFRNDSYKKFGQNFLFKAARW